MIFEGQLIIIFKCYIIVEGCLIIVEGQLSETLINFIIYDIFHI
jgi:hypothetical protein